MAREQITIAGTAYSRTEATKYFRAMLRRYLLNQPLDAADHAAIVELLERHPLKAEKVGTGIAEIRVTNGGRFGNRHFELHRTDGTTANFSYLVCISPDNDHEGTRDALWAMRCEVVDQTRQFFDAAHKRTAVFCEITGERLTPKNSHVDHMRPLTFQRLVRDFFATKKLTLADLKTTKAGAVTSMASRDLAEAWREYHRAHANLRIASKRANLKERKPKVDFTAAPTLF